MIRLLGRFERKTLKFIFHEVNINFNPLRTFIISTASERCHKPNTGWSLNARTDHLTLNRLAAGLRGHQTRE